MTLLLSGHLLESKWRLVFTYWKGLICMSPNKGITWHKRVLDVLCVLLMIHLKIKENLVKVRYLDFLLLVELIDGYCLNGCFLIV